MHGALNDSERGFGKLTIKADPAALSFLAEVSDGDARRSLNALEIAVLTTPPNADGVIELDRAVAAESIQNESRRLRCGETEHYDTNQRLY